MKDCVPLGQVQASAGSALVGSPGWPSFLLTFSYSCPKPCPSALFSHDLTGHQPSLLDILVLAPMTVCPPTASWAALGSFDSSPAVPGAASPPSLSLIVVPFQNSSRRLSTEPHTGTPTRPLRRHHKGHIWKKLPTRTSYPHLKYLSLCLHSLGMAVLHPCFVSVRNDILQLRFFSYPPHSPGPLPIVFKCFRFVLSSPSPWQRYLHSLPRFLQDCPNCSASDLFPRPQYCRL